jgi:NAD(P)-dependent dehydrogenase (short-subunit alcohol dehydrogenase family)
MSLRLEGKVVAINGAAGGIGTAIARRFAAEGASLALSDINSDGLESTADEARKEGADVVTASGDAASSTDVEAFVAAAGNHFGRLDGVVAAAGRVAGSPIEETSEELWDELHATNVKSQFLLIKHALPQLRKADNPAIVNFASIGGVLGFGSMPAYTSSKAAVTGLTRTLAVDLSGDGIRVNAVSPATIDTAMPRSFLADFAEAERPAVEEAFVARHLIKRLGTPEEVANVVLFLISDEASFLTGLVIPIDGGWTAW